MNTKFKILNRFISLVLALVMVLGMVPRVPLTASAATYSAAATLAGSGHRYSVTITRLDRHDGTDVYYYYGNVSSVQCTSITETDDTVSVGVKIYFQYINGGIVDTNATVTVDKTTCDEAISETVEANCDISGFVATIRVERAVYAHSGDATCVTAASCTVCGKSYIASGNHKTTGNWLWEADGHYQICGYGCGSRIEVDSCDYTTATCSAASVCSVCKHQKSGIDSTAHSWNSWTSNGDGTHSRTCAHNSSHTETEDCSGTATCEGLAVCGVCKKEYGEPLGHSTDKADDRAATCTEPAYCSVCGKSYGEALGHSIGKEGDRAATCTEPAWCSVCQESYGEALGHSSGKEGDRAATHAVRGYCSVCQQEYGEVDPDAHVFSNGFCDCGGYEPATDTNADGIYEIGNAGQLYWFGAQVAGGNHGINGVLTADIVVNEKVLNDDGTLVADTDSLRAWVPIGVNSSILSVFMGTLDGQYHTVSGLYFNGLYSAGLVAMNWGTIKNVGVVDSYIFGTDSVGGIVGSNSSSGSKVGYISNCYYIGFAGTKYDANGIVASNRSPATVENCYYLGTEELDSLDGTTFKTAEQLASGEVAYLLNGDQSSIGWYQTCGKGYPAASGKRVYQGTLCDGTTVGYSNTANDTKFTATRIISAPCAARPRRLTKTIRAFTRSMFLNTLWSSPRS